ncbi:hypothetical protein ACWT_1004 [Actinoplanes sp. SE50]|uniref:hypothetical protein n=1 Tax=unclassified Actinoplanes TaxID=2626549 RepID=UPI00023EC8E9|nr:MULTISPECIES: hypothetical protein [unclassified Actinoplanes]AEV82020.1 hypothetical protein ACPL_1123 [Actinoplanes sp. SE50/110]ATO80419.1 hypothetical protein ACWT_1004 [Actinoplanes sp. SE50]SLL97826.1 hypothetical protein ACSP50_1037 [Actinoplanes sp. SE50/110]
MTTTALMPVDPSVTPQQAARVLSIRANLLPQDISDGRRARRTRTAVLVAVVLVLNGLGYWYWQAAAERKDADAEYAAITKQVADVQRGQNKYQEVVKIRNRNTLVEGQLAKLMADDLSWQAMLDLVRTTGTASKTTVTQISGSLNAAALKSDGVGLLSVSGTAPDKKAVADYVKALAALGKKGLADPFVSNVATAAGGGVNFNLTVSITDPALCGKYSVKKCPSGGN